MREEWSAEELTASWTLTEQDMRMIGDRVGADRLLFAVLLKFSEVEGSFPEFREHVPTEVVTYVAEQVDVDPDEFYLFGWRRRTIAKYVTRIRPGSLVPRTEERTKLTTVGLAVGGALIVIAGFFSVIGLLMDRPYYVVVFAEPGDGCDGDALYLDSTTGEQLSCVAGPFTPLSHVPSPKVPDTWTDGSAASIGGLAERLSAGGIDEAEREQINLEAARLGSKDGHNGQGAYVAARASLFTGLALLTISGIGALASRSSRSS